MKKLFFACMIALLWAGMAWGDDEDYYKYKVFNLSSAREEIKEAAQGAISDTLTVYYFDGFDFEKYDPVNHPDLTELVEYAIEAIVEGKGDSRVTGYKPKEPMKICNKCNYKCEKGKICKICEPSKPCEPKEKVYSYSIIGHSQGGLRALGYIKQLKNKYPNDPNILNDIDAVITISGIDQGLKMLEGGLPELKNRVSRKINIVGNGLRAVAVTAIDISTLFNAAGGAGTGDPLLILAEGTVGFILETVGGTLLAIPRNNFAKAFSLVLSFLPKEIQAYWITAWLTADANLVPQIRDMIPGSKYISDNVVKKKPYPYWGKTGNKKLACEWQSTKILGIRIWYLWIGLVDEYALYTAYDSVPQFNTDVPVGFIAGLDSKTLNMIEDESVKKTVNDSMKVAETTFGVAQGWHIAKCFGPVGLVTGSVTYANDADKARRFIANFESEFNVLKGSNQNDGLVALENQYIPKSFTDPDTKITTQHLHAVLGKTKEGYEGIRNRNHKNIVETSEAFMIANKMIEDARILRGRP
jgi:hypothetical protein